MAIVLVALLSVIGLGIDAGKLYIDSLRVQRAADAGVLAGTSLIGDALFGTQANIEGLARDVARDNFDRHLVPYNPADLGTHFEARLRTPNELEVRTYSPSSTYIIGKVVEGQGIHDLSGFAAGRRRPVAVVLVNDLSSSMMEPPEKFDALRAAARVFASSFDEAQDAFGMVSFWRNTAVDYPLSRPWVRQDITPDVPDDVDGAINCLIIEGCTPPGYPAACPPCVNKSGTNIHGGVWQGRQEMDRFLALVPDPSAFLKVIVLITDGSPTRVPLAAQNTPDIYPAGCPRYPNGGGNPVDPNGPISPPNYAGVERRA
jgi:hypothetical protein